MKQIHVVAGVLRDARGRVLLARRTRGRDLAGLWEFSGGKVEPGEAPAEALVRELQEELGVAAVVGEALIRVPQQYPDKRLVLDVCHVRFQGTPKGLDGQALAWVPPHKLMDYPMPPADRPVVAALLQPDRCVSLAQDDENALQAALQAGVGRVLLQAAENEDALMRCMAHCKDAGADLLVTGDVALAQWLGTGVVLDAAQLRDETVQSRVRELQHTGASVAVGCSGANELQLAEALGCRFAVWQGSAEAFAAAREQAALPVYLPAVDVAAARAQGAQGPVLTATAFPA